MSMIPFGFGMDPFADFGVGAVLPGLGLGLGSGTGSGTRRSVFPSSGHAHGALAPIDDRQLLDFGRLAADPLPVDVEDREQEYLVRVHQRESGMRKKDLRVDVEHGMLTIRGERESESGDAAQGGHYSRHYRSVSRSMALPENIDENKIEARYEGNNLIIHVPKTGATGGRRSIQIGGMGMGAGQQEHKQAADKPAAAPQQGQGQGQGQVHAQTGAPHAQTGTGAGVGAGAPSPHAQTPGQTHGHAQSHGQSQGHHA